MYLDPKRFCDSAGKKKKKAHSWSPVTETVPCRQKELRVHLRVASHYRIIINNNGDDDNDDDNDDDDDNDNR